MPITEKPLVILYDIPIVYKQVAGSTQFGAERGVVCNSIPEVVGCRTTPTLTTLDV